MTTVRMQWKEQGENAHLRFNKMSDPHFRHHRDGNGIDDSFDHVGVTLVSKEWRFEEQKDQYFALSTAMVQPLAAKFGHRE